MGNVPRLVGKFVDLALRTDVRVVDKTNFPSDFFLVTTLSSTLIGKSIRALSKIELDLGDGHFKSYTPARIDSISGSVRFCFHNHNHKQGTGRLVDVRNVKNLGAVTNIFDPEDGIEFPKDRDMFFAWGSDRRTGIDINTLSSGKSRKGALFSNKRLEEFKKVGIA